MQLRINAAINYTFYIHANFMIQLNLTCEKQISVAIASKGRKKKHTITTEIWPLFSLTSKSEYDHKILHGSGTQ